MSEEPAVEQLPDIRVVSCVSDDETVWNARLECDMEPFAAIGMMVVALAREVLLYATDTEDDDDD